MPNKRQTYRVPCHIETTLFKQKSTESCIIKDISFEGCCVHVSSEIPFKIHQYVRINLLPHHTNPGMIHGCIMSISSDAKMLHLHIKFTISSPIEKKLIRSLVTQLERLYIQTLTYSNTKPIPSQSSISDDSTIVQEIPNNLSIKKLVTPSKERRKIYRIPCQIKTSLTYGNDTYPALIRNVSLYGCCIYLISKQHFEKNKLVTFTLSTTPSDAISIQGEILQVSPHTKGTSLHLKFAFTHPAEAQGAKSCITAIQTQYIKNKCQAAKNA